MKVEYTRTHGKCLTYVIEASSRGYTIRLGNKLLKTGLPEPSGALANSLLWSDERAKIHLQRAKDDIEQLQGMNEE